MSGAVLSVTTFWSLVGEFSRFGSCNCRACRVWTTSRLPRLPPLCHTGGWKGIGKGPAVRIRRLSVHGLIGGLE